MSAEETFNMSVRIRVSGGDVEVRLKRGRDEEVFAISPDDADAIARALRRSVARAATRAHLRAVK